MPSAFVHEFFSTYFLLLGALCLFVCLGLFSTLKLFPIKSTLMVKKIVFACQLVFHYLLVSLLIFLWFNFQLSDAVHGHFAFLDKQVEHMNLLHVHKRLSWSHFYVVFEDGLNL